MMQLSGAVPPTTRPVDKKPKNREDTKAERLNRTKKAIALPLFLLILLFLGWKFFLRPLLLPLTMTTEEIREAKINQANMDVIPVRLL